MSNSRPKLFLLIKDPTRCIKQTHLSRETETRTIHEQFQTKTEREGADVRAGRHMPSAEEFQRRRDWPKPAELADNDSGNFSNVPRFRQAVASGRRVKGSQTGHPENSAVGQNPNQHQNWLTFPEPSMTKHIFESSRGLFSLGESKGARK